MLTPEEEKFVQYWKQERQHKKKFLRKFSIALPAVTLLVVAFFVNFLSGWYKRADQEIRRHSSLIIVVLIAILVIVVFVVVFSARLKWEQNEADYASLLKKKSLADNP